MSEIKAVGKLREQAEREPLALTYILNDIADEIEAEIAANYIKLPTDKNGNVIHVGDMVKHADGGVYEVLGVDNDGTRQGVFINTGEGRYPIDSWCASGMELYKPRTLEDVLQDRINDVLIVMTSGIPISLESTLNDAFGEECVNEIRELMCGDAE